MSIETEYELSCTCDECNYDMHFVEVYDATDIEYIALKNGWEVRGGFSGRVETNHHVCPKCVEEAK